MALIAMADNSIDIPAERDGALYNYFSNGENFIIKGIGEELAVTTTTSSLVVTLGTGEGVICGRHIVEQTADGAAATTLTLPASSSGYILIRYDRTKTVGNEVSLLTASSTYSENINDTGYYNDLILYSFVTNATSITSITDKRNVRAGLGTNTTKSITIAASGWSNGKYTIYDDGITANSIQELIPSESITPAQYIAMRSAQVVQTSQIAGSITLTAFGTVPAIDIPVILILNGTYKTAIEESTVSTARITDEHAWEIIGVPLTNWTERTISGTTYYQYTATTSQAYIWDTINIRPYATGTNEVPTDDELKEFNSIVAFGLNDTGEKSINIISTAAPTTTYNILVTGVKMADE